MVRLLSIVGCVAAGEVGPDTHFNTQLALTSAAENSVVKALKGVDLQTYQRQRLGLEDGEKVHQAPIRPTSTRLCEGDKPDDWLTLKCRAVTISIVSHCNGNPRCFSLRIASFIKNDSKLIKAVQEGLVEPCKAVPDPKSLEHFGVQNIHEPGTLQPAKVDWAWLFCDTHPVTAMLTRESDGTFTVRYSR